MDVTWNATTNKAVSPMDAGLKKVDEADALAWFDLDEVDDDEIQRNLVSNPEALDNSASAKRASTLITGDVDTNTLGSLTQVQKGIAPATSAPPAKTSLHKKASRKEKTKDSDTIASDQANYTDNTAGTAATSETAIGLVEDAMADIMGVDPGDVANMSKT
eukprot:scaffold210798_cov41-Attheya_sp.AAC.1